MIVVPITFKYAEISKYSREESVLKICFSDGSKDIFIQKSSNELDKTEDFTNKIIAETRNLAKEKNKQNNTGVLNDVVTVRFTDDEEAVYEKLNIAFSRIKDEIKKAKTSKTPQNYLQMIANMQGMKFNL